MFYRKNNLPQLNIQQYKQNRLINYLLCVQLDAHFYLFHDVGKFSIEQNVQLREMIIQARKETVKNLK